MASTVFTAASFAGYDFDVTRTGKLDGLTTPSYSVSESDLAGVRGSHFNQALMRKRQVTLETMVQCESEDEYFTKRAAILAACNKENGQDELVLTIHGDDYLLYAVPEPPVIDWPRGGYFTVQTQFIAYDPTIYSADTYSEAGVNPPSGGGFVFPVVFPITFTGSGQTGRISVDNTGNITTYPTLILTGPLTNPVVENESTDEFFSLNMTLASGQQVEVDMTAKQALLDGVTNVAQYVDSGTTWWGLPPGRSDIRLTTDSTADLGSMEIQWRNSWGAL